MTSTSAPAPTPTPSRRKVVFYGLLAVVITVVFYGITLFRQWQLAEQTRSFCLLHLKMACAAYAEDHHDFPESWEQIVKAGYLKESCCFFACPYVDNRLTPLPRHWSKSDFILRRSGKQLIIKLRDDIHIQHQTDEQQAEQFSMTLEFDQIPPVAKSERKQLLYY